jgi:multidrug efflux system outer membrane protein
MFPLTERLAWMPLALAWLASGLAGCALQAPASTTLAALPPAWARLESTPSAPPAPQGSPTADTADAPAAAWWRALADPALHTLVEAAEQNSPTLAHALARLDEARANAGVQAAAQGPALRGDVQGQRGTPQSGQGAASTQASSSASTGLNLSWELDLFGRLRHNQAAAEQRLAASTADARAARLSLQTQAADRVIAWRACQAQSAVRQEDLRSRAATLRMTEARQAAGQAAPIDTARLRSSLADAQINRICTEELCVEVEQQLVALSGWPLDQVKQLLLAPLQTKVAPHPVPHPIPRAVPEPPPLQPTLPASVLAQHPSVLAAMRRADASWEDVGTAEAARRPSLSLTALLNASWIGVAGSWLRSTSWSIAPQIGTTLWDGGRGKAQADAARARHAQALASLESTVRATVQEVENALALAHSAGQREQVAQAGVTAATQLLLASEASQRAGRMSLFELEDARRSANHAQLASISAQGDRARAWVALVKATANTPAPPPTPPVTPQP